MPRSEFWPKPIAPLSTAKAQQQQYLPSGAVDKPLYIVTASHKDLCCYLCKRIACNWPIKACYSRLIHINEVGLLEIGDVLTALTELAAFFEIAL